MLISKVTDDNEGYEQRCPQEDDQEYQTANELFELMAKNQNFENDTEETLTANDLVLLYKNIELGTQLMSTANSELRLKKPNQYVETIIYSDSDESDISEVFSSEDIHDVVLINGEKLDLFNSGSSPIDNPLCHKFGNFELQTNFNLNYNREFLFQDHYIKDKLKDLNIFEYQHGKTALPASLLDYICCKRLDDYDNFDMDNLIRYVKHTIEQLKRISNGDYLTEKVKEKWAEVNVDISHPQINNAILPNCASIPLHFERKIKLCNTTWEDIVHSEVDIRTLTKILEKKIVLEIPRTIYGSFTIYNKKIMSCSKKKLTKLNEEKAKEASVNVIVKLQPSNEGNVFQNISSIMVLQTNNSEVIQNSKDHFLALDYNVETKHDDKEPNVMELHDHETTQDTHHTNMDNDIKSNSNIEVSYISQDSNNNLVKAVSSSYLVSDNPQGELHSDDTDFYFSTNTSANSIGETNDDSETHDSNETEDSDKKQDVSNNLSPHEDFNMTMQLLIVPSSVPEESIDDITEKTAIKKKSGTKLRIKSPYENKSFLIEEKKRKRLLEIRDRREKKKLAMNEKLKNKYRKQSQPVAANSVTKLSITNKYFYNSIYGNNLDVENKSTKSKSSKSNSEVDQLSTNESGIQDKSYNKSYYLDDAVTEMMCLEMKEKENSEDLRLGMNYPSATNSNDFHSDLDLLSQLVVNTMDTIENKENMPSAQNHPQSLQKLLALTESNISIQSKVNSAKYHNNDNAIISKDNKINENLPNQPLRPISAECRKSINKIYELITDIHTNKSESKISNLENVCPDNNVEIPTPQSESIIHGSESGTSLKHQTVASSNPSSFSFGKQQKTESKTVKYNRKLTGLEPKVVINTKLNKTDVDRNKMDRKKNIFNPRQDNPLKAISQLLHEFDNVQKTRSKVMDIKSPKNDPIAEPRIGMRSARKYYRIDNRDEIQNDRVQRNEKITIPKKFKLNATEPAKPQNYQEEKYTDKSTKKKVSDIIDEEKESRGEAVRGPSRVNSRLNSLAQPKKSYVLAHSEEFQTKYGRNLMADRLQRLAATSSSLDRSSTAKSKIKRPNDLVVGHGTKFTPQSLPPIEVAEKQRRPCSSSPEKKHVRILEPFKKQDVAETTEILKKKVVLINTRAKSVEYGRVTSPTTEVQYSRVPLVPADLELVSMTSSPIGDESNAIGNQLHEMVHTMMKKSEVFLNDLAEPEFEDTPINTFDDMHSDKASTVDIFQDKTVATAVENIYYNSNNDRNEFEYDNNFENNNNESKNVLKKLENALYRKLSVGAFPKKLRLKNFTLTPRNSMQQIVVVQSGDDGSIFLESTISHTKIKASKSENMSDIRTLPVFSKSNIDWTFSNFPMQIATVGYAFPKLLHPSCQSNYCNKDNVNVYVESNRRFKIDRSSDKNIQCIEGGRSNFRTDVSYKINADKIRHIDKVDIYQNIKESHCNTVSIVTQTELVENTSKTENNKKSSTEMSHNSSPIVKNGAENKDTGKTGAIDYTTSLDILVGLLNEIQNISSCQTNIMTNEISQKKLVDGSQQCILYNNTMEPFNISTDIISSTPVDELKQLEQNPLNSLNISNNDHNQVVCFNTLENSNMIFPEVSDKMVDTSEYLKDICVDKDVNVNILENECVDSFNDVPSRLFQVQRFGTNSSNTCVLSQPSSQSTVSVEYHSFDSNSIEVTKVIELEDADIKNENDDFALVPSNYESSNNVQEIYESIKCKKQGDENVENLDSLKTISSFVLPSRVEHNLKIKRDILVTVYSLLVMTIFAALSLPDLLYR